VDSGREVVSPWILVERLFSRRRAPHAVGLLYLIVEVQGY
jgi:hypothetical protein